jgi:AAA+ ATPase superfamily predicted ATPase
MPEFLFDREQEMDGLRRRLSAVKSFLLYGPSGVGKTLLLSRLLPELPHTIYSAESTSAQTVFRNLGVGLLAAGSPRLVRSFGTRPEGIRSKSATALKGIVMDALREDRYCVVLDNLKLPSQAFAAAIREVAGWGGTAVVAVARSAHNGRSGIPAALFPGSFRAI